MHLGRDLEFSLELCEKEENVIFPVAVSISPILCWPVWHGTGRAKATAAGTRQLKVPLMVVFGKGRLHPNISCNACSLALTQHFRALQPILWHCAHKKAIGEEDSLYFESTHPLYGALGV